MNDNIPELTIEFDDGTGDGLILLESDNGGNIDRVAIHPIHLRYMAEKTGLIATSEPQAQRTIAMLTRRLNLLRDRVDHLAEWLAKHSDHEHADLSYETTYATATADIADEFCVDLDRPHLATLPDALTPCANIGTGPSTTEAPAASSNGSQIGGQP